jgi:deoxyadenosine/deoxycytidine kinase
MQTEAYKRRSQEMSELESTQGKKKVGSTGTKFQDYARYNEKDKTVEIDWDKVNAIKDQDDYNAVVDYINSLEDVQKKMEDAESSLLDIEG